MDLTKKMYVSVCFTDLLYPMISRPMRKRMESTSNLLVCTNGCGRKYTNKYLLNRHLRYECGVNKHFVCEDCGKTFSHNFNLKSHSVIVHKKIPS